MNLKNHLIVISNVILILINCYSGMSLADTVDEHKAFFERLSPEEKKYIKEELSKDKLEYFKQRKALNDEQAEAASDIYTRQWTKEDLVAKGKSVYEANCASCHMPNGEGVPGAFPALRASQVATGDINIQIKLVAEGKGLMPAYSRMLSALDFAAVVTYIRNGLGNSTGDFVQPSAVSDLQSPKSSQTLSPSIKPSLTILTESMSVSDPNEPEELSKPIEPQAVIKPENSKHDLDIAIKNTKNAETLSNNLDDDPFELTKKLEVFKLKSRPMFLLCGGLPWISDDKIKKYDDVFSRADKIQMVSKSVGELRIYHKDDNNWTLMKSGVATVVGVDPTHVITNAHVLSELNLIYQRDDKWHIKSAIHLDVLFPDESTDCNNRRSTKTIEIVDINKLDEKLDVVTLETKTQEVPAISIPASINNITSGDQIAVIGYPSKPGQEDTFLSGLEINKLYAAPDGIVSVPALRLSYGEITPKDNNAVAEARLFRHDATTWGASSGSLVLRLRDGAFIGLHQGGMKSKAEGFGFNYLIPTTEIANALK